MTARARGIGSLAWSGLAVAVVAAILRVPGLAALPLGATESANAWFAWQLAHGELPLPLERLRPVEPSALLGSLYWWLAALGIDSDLAVRLPGALAGVALALVPLGLSDRIGRRAALFLAALIAVDPVLVAVARRDATVSLGLFVAAATVALAMRSTARAKGQTERESPIGFSVSLGVLLAAGWSAWASLPWLVLAAARRSKNGLEVAVRVVWRPVAVAAALASSAGLFAWPLVPSVAASLTSFLEHIGRGCAESGAHRWSLEILALDPFAFLGGAVAVGALLRSQARRRVPGTRRLLAACFWGLFLLAVTRGAPEALPYATLPLLAAVAWLAADARDEARSGDSFADARLESGASPGSWGSRLRSMRSRLSRRLLPGVVALGVAVSAGVSANQVQRGQMKAWDAILPPPAHGDVRRLAADLAGATPSLGRRQLGERLALQLSPWPDPVLGWYLREFGGRWIEGPASAAALGAPSALLTQAGATPWDWIEWPSERPTPVGRSYRVRVRPPAREREAAPAIEAVSLWTDLGIRRSDG